MIDYVGVALLGAWTVSVWCLFTLWPAKVGLVRKAVWTAVLLVPVVGVLVWAVAGPRGA